MPSSGQSAAGNDIINQVSELKRKNDSTEASLRNLALKLKQDSIEIAITSLQAERMRTRDSIARQKKMQRDAARANQKAAMLRKKERAHIRESIDVEIKKAAAARKANKKKQSDKKSATAQTVLKETNKQPSFTNEKPPRLLNEKETEAKTTIRNYPAEINLSKTGQRALPAKKTTYFSFQLGPSGYIGDLGGNSQLENNLLGDVNFKENTFLYGFTLSHLRREAIGFRFSYILGNIAGSDQNTYYSSKDDPSYNRYLRNLDFRTKINEASLMLEVYPLKFFRFHTAANRSYLQPCLLGGIGTFSFNPQGSYFDKILDEDVWVDLQPLSTEGQGMIEYPNRAPYKLRQWNIPYGVGFHYELSPTIRLGLEFVGRHLFTDYLDDVSTTFIDPALFDKYLTVSNAEIAKLVNNKSRFVDASKAYNPGQQRGDAGNNDMYFSISGRIIIKLNRNKDKFVKSTKRSLGVYKYDDNEICE